MNARTFFTALKRRRVNSVAVAYVVVAWLLIQVATQVFPFFNIPNWIVRLVVLLAIVGFPIAVVCAWALEMTAEGIKLEGDIDRRITRKTGRKLTALIVIVAAMAAGVTVFRVLHSQQGIEAAKQPPLAVAIESKSIAVLPFENLSEEKANDYFADGMQDEILINLARIADRKVIRRRPTIAIWPMSSRSKARSPRPSPSSCRRSSRLTRRKPSSSRPRLIWPLSTFTAGRSQFSSRKVSA